ncbi:unnamed protein product [Amoebophrya sp. A120]|nr:unnamed protein product [Amoebophrya sp. A120]|eukprot:GSA120T00005493001.1
MASHMLPLAGPRSSGTGQYVPGADDLHQLLNENNRRTTGYAGSRKTTQASIQSMQTDVVPTGRNVFSPMSMEDHKVVSVPGGFVLASTDGRKTKAHVDEYKARYQNQPPSVKSSRATANQLTVSDRIGSGSVKFQPQQPVDPETAALVETLRQMQDNTFQDVLAHTPNPPQWNSTPGSGPRGSQVGGQQQTGPRTSSIQKPRYQDTRDAFQAEYGVKNALPPQANQGPKKKVSTALKKVNYVKSHIANIDKQVRSYAIDRSPSAGKLIPKNAMDDQKIEAVAVRKPGAPGDAPRKSVVEEVRKSMSSRASSAPPPGSILRVPVVLTRPSQVRASRTSQAEKSTLFTDKYAAQVLNKPKTEEARMLQNAAILEELEAQHGYIPPHARNLILHENTPEVQTNLDQILQQPPQVSRKTRLEFREPPAYIAEQLGLGVPDPERMEGLRYLAAKQQEQREINALQNSLPKGTDLQALSVRQSVVPSPVQAPQLVPPAADSDLLTNPRVSGLLGEMRAAGNLKPFDPNDPANNLIQMRVKVGQDMSFGPTYISSADATVVDDVKPASRPPSSERKSARFGPKSEGESVHREFDPLARTQSVAGQVRDILYSRSKSPLPPAATAGRASSAGGRSGAPQLGYPAGQARGRSRGRAEGSAGGEDGLSLEVGGSVSLGDPPRAPFELADLRGATFDQNYDLAPNAMGSHHRSSILRSNFETGPPEQEFQANRARSRSSGAETPRVDIEGNVMDRKEAELVDDFLSRPPAYFCMRNRILYTNVQKLAANRFADRALLPRAESEFLQQLDMLNVQLDRDRDARQRWQEQADLATKETMQQAVNDTSQVQAKLEILNRVSALSMEDTKQLRDSLREKEVAEQEEAREKSRKSSKRQPSDPGRRSTTQMTQASRATAASAVVAAPAGGGGGVPAQGQARSATQASSVSVEERSTQPKKGIVQQRLEAMKSKKEVQRADIDRGYALVESLVGPLAARPFNDTYSKAKPNPVLAAATTSQKPATAPSVRSEGSARLSASGIVAGEDEHDQVLKSRSKKKNQRAKAEGEASNYGYYDPYGYYGAGYYDKHWDSNKHWSDQYDNYIAGPGAGHRGAAQWVPPPKGGLTAYGGATGTYNERKFGKPLSKQELGRTDFRKGYDWQAGRVHPALDDQLRGPPRAMGAPLKYSIKTYR